MKFDIGFDELLAPVWLRRWGPLRRAPGTLLDRTALHYYALSASIGAVMIGAFSLGMVVLKKSLDASEMQIGLMGALGPTMLLLGIFGSELVRGRDRRPVIAWFGGLSRGVFLLFAFCKAAWCYIAIAGVYNAMHSLLAPAVTTLWQTNVSTRHRNALWGLTVSLTTIISVTTAFAVGWTLDLDGDAYRWVFPLAGAFGLLSIAILVRMPHRGRFKQQNPPRRTFRGVVVSPIARFLRLLRDDADFRHFEGAFMLYGVAFMLLVPVLPHYIVDLAQMTYLQASIGEGVLFQLGAIALSMPWGRYMDRTSPSATCARVFALLAFFPAILMFGPSVHHNTGLPLFWVVFAAYTVFGIGMSGVGVAWNLAPINFAGQSDASAYTGAHITLTGVRGALAPIFGALGFKYFGYMPVLAVSLLLFLCAALGMWLLERKMSACRGAVEAAAA